MEEIVVRRRINSTVSVAAFVMLNRLGWNSMLCNEFMSDRLF